MKRILPFAKYEFLKFLKLNSEYNNIAYTFLRNNELLPLYVRQKSMFILYKTFKNLSISKLLYVCIVTGKTRAVNTNYKMSNLYFKIMIKKGAFCGLI